MILYLSDKEAGGNPMQQYKIQQFDKLTGLPYYDDFLNLAENIRRTELNNGKQYAIIATDISNFKFINQIYGYEVGNQLLKDMVRTLVLENPYCLCACRPYSDHILGLYVKPTDSEQFEDGLMKYNRTFIEQNSRKFQSVLLHLQCGICVMDHESDSVVACVDRANIARRRMKGDYSVQYVIFNEDMYRGKERTSEVISTFETALKLNNILVYYQPKVNCRTGVLEGAEALSRIRREDGSIMTPGEYIPILESSSRILDLDFYVMKQAFTMIRNLLSEGLEPVVISVNLSRVHFYNDRMVQDILDVFTPFDIPARFIEFEVTESAFMSESGIISDKLTELKSLGFLVSMDDFGTGYSSLHSLSVLPIDVVKFDASFVRNSTVNPKGLKILSGLISLCKQIDFDVICEGVENDTEQDIVRECGCDHVQGYVYDQPLPSEIFIEKYMNA